MNTGTAGYLHVALQSFKPLSLSAQIKMYFQIKLGEATVNTTLQSVTENVNSVYLLQIPSDIPRLILILNDHQNLSLASCRIEIKAFFAYQGKTNIFNSELVNNEGQSIAQLSVRLTYYSSQHGKLKIKINDIILNSSMVEKYKNLSVRFKLGPFIKTSQNKDYDRNGNNKYDDILELVILNPSFNLVINLVSEQNVIGEFTIYGIQKSGIGKEKKLIENNLFWNQNHSGKVKYECEFIATI